jgi:hypothetical protein
VIATLASSTLEDHREIEGFELGLDAVRAHISPASQSTRAGALSYTRLARPTTKLRSFSAALQQVIEKRATWLC